jgi:hypothetical protein
VVFIYNTTIEFIVRPILWVMTITILINFPYHIVG